MRLDLQLQSHYVGATAELFYSPGGICFGSIFRARGVQYPVAFWLTTGTCKHLQLGDSSLVGCI